MLRTDLETYIYRKPSVSEIYVICAPISEFDKATKAIGSLDSNGVSLSIFYTYFKSILTEKISATLQLWSFIILDKQVAGPSKDSRVSTV